MSDIANVYLTKDGDAWLEQNAGTWFIFGHVDGASFIISGPWDSEESADRYLDRLKRWARARSDA